MAETKIIYHIDEEETPYLVKIAIPAERISLLDFKQVLNKPNYKFFFKSMDQDFGVVKEEISDDNAKLPCFNGRVVSWLVSSDVPAALSAPEPTAPAPVETHTPSPPPPPLPPPPAERTGGIGDSRPPSFHDSEEEFFGFLEDELDVVCVPAEEEEEEEEGEGEDNFTVCGGEGDASREWLDVT
ncbi:hypothetical protein ACEWY4_025509 [Coilia grayii]|uniref:DIX domain-containing protein n=1 Tax=Coilia grayii TaxID=363190 RepID=A0ABD1IZR8_9TELE